MDWHKPVEWTEHGILIKTTPLLFGVLTFLFIFGLWMLVRLFRGRLTKVKVNLPFGFGETEWVTDEGHRQVAWALYVELVTRISVQELHPGQGLIREALSSLYSLFDTTRQILRDYKGTHGLFPSGHIPALREAALKKYAGTIELEVGAQ